MTKGIAIIGCGRIGRIRGKIASEFPGISWIGLCDICLLYTSPSPRDLSTSRMPSSA